MKILITGLSGSGKTTLAKALAKELNAKHLNADEIRHEYNDWDFSEAGRLRQAHRIKNLSDKHDLVVCDFIAANIKILIVYLSRLINIILELQRKMQINMLK